jgi:hypothetical protein
MIRCAKCGRLIPAFEVGIVPVCRWCGEKVWPELLPATEIGGAGETVTISRAEFHRLCMLDIDHP